MAKSEFSLGKEHTALENMWVIFKYLLILELHSNKRRVTL